MAVLDVALLTSPEGRALLAGLPPYDARDALRVGEDLRRAGHSPALVAAALTQSRLRTRVADRWGAAGASLLTHLLLTPEGAEQATRPSVSALRAERYGRVAAGALVADLGCGVGIDALALADVTSLPPEVTARWDAAFADPARRRDGRQLLRPEGWSPQLSWVIGLPVPTSPTSHPG